MVEKSKPDYGMLEWTDARLDDMFFRSEARPLAGFVNGGEHRVDLATHEIYNDQRWKGFMPKGLPATEASARLTLGYAKKLWKARNGFGGETQDFGGTITTAHSVKDINSIAKPMVCLLAATLFLDTQTRCSRTSSTIS